MKNESKIRLEAFIEEAEKIRQLPYFKNKDNIIGFHADAKKGEITFYQPSNNDRDALLFSLRLFIQKKDIISFEKMGELSNDPGISQIWKNEFTYEHQLLEKKLNFVCYEGNNKKQTYKDVFNIIMWNLAHIKNNESRKEFVKIHNDQNLWEINHYTFHKIVLWYSRAIFNISAASNEELHRNSLLH
jgi:hypothetical protein